MLGALIDHQPLKELITSLPGNLFPAFENRDAWEAICAADREDLLALARRYEAKPYPMLTATQFMAFVRDGSRKAFEDPYFERRRKLIAAALHCCVTGEVAQLDAVIDGLWCICEETSWVISAHNVNSIPGARPAQETPLPDPERINVDLFAAQTGMILALVTQMLQGLLDEAAPVICRRVRQEVEKRVLVPFMARDDFWWMGYVRQDLNNWTPWILSNVMLAACIMEHDRLHLCSLLERACRMLDRWIDCMPEDGGCDEGASYWNMAGGAMLDCLELLDWVTQGRLTVWDQPKIGAILRFPAHAQLGNGWFVNFADCDARPMLCGERLRAAGCHLNNAALIRLGRDMFGKPSDEIADVPHLSRLLSRLFACEGAATAGYEPERDVWLPDLQLRVKEEEGFLLCVKGGHNGESHNHNDVGSYMLYVDGEPVIVDAGNMIYTAKTFSSERYTLWNTRAAYHNLPIINGCEQQAGAQYCASDVQCKPYGIQLELTEAYPVQAHIVQAGRALSVRYGMFLLDDDITLSQAAPVTEVFMLRHKPELDDQGCIVSGPVSIGPIDSGAQICIEEIRIEDARMARSFPGSLWRVLVTYPAAEHHSLRFIIDRKE